MLSMRPGEWVMRVDPEMLAGLRATSDPLRLVIPNLVEGASISGLEVRVR